MAGRNQHFVLNLPERIRMRRKEKGMTQTALGNAVGSNKSAVSKWENGEHIPDVQTLVKIADALDVTLPWLLGGGEKETDEDFEEIKKKYYCMEKEKARQYLNIILDIANMLLS